MKETVDIEIDISRNLMDQFAKRTGLLEKDGDPRRRYLWTDAYALQNFLALEKTTGDRKYADISESLIEHVHHTLGKFSEDDHRSGWISGLPDEVGSQHPTKSGLRIGKELPERKEYEPFDDQLEWERDGQYYHYHTRWIKSLLQAGRKLGRQKYFQSAAELSLAGKHFLHESHGIPHIYWKMSVDLSRPQVTSMGAHDPLDGYLSAQEARLYSGNEFDFSNYLEKLERICSGRRWETSDPLGIGGLLLDAVRSAVLSRHQRLPDPFKPQRLIDDAFSGLSDWRVSFDRVIMASHRLAFRECGLSLGLRVMDGYRDLFTEQGLNIEPLDSNLDLAESIERFWSLEENRNSTYYRNHLDINDVSLSSSLLAGQIPEAFGSPLKLDVEPSVS